MARRRHDQLIKSIYWGLLDRVSVYDMLQDWATSLNFPLAAIRPEGGRLRGRFAQTTETGRWSSQNPPRSNISHSDRPQGVEPPIQGEYVRRVPLIDADYAGFELRAASHTVHMDSERRIRAEERERVRRAVLGVPGLPGPLVVPFEIMPFQEEVLRAAGVQVIRVHDSVNLDFGDLDAVTIRALLRHIGLVPGSGEREPSDSNTPGP